MLIAIAPNGSFSQSAEPPDALSAQTKAYVALVYADEARDQENWEKAKKHYEQAFKVYEALARRFPDFNTQIVEYRSAYCVNQLHAIQSRLNAPAPFPVPAEVPTPKPAPQSDPLLQSKYQATVKENQYLLDQIEKLTDRIDELNDSSPWELKNQQLDEENRRLKSAQNKTENAMLTDLNKARSETENARKELDRLKQELADQQQAAETARNERAQRLALQAELKKIQAQQDPLQQRVAAAEQELLTTKTDLEKIRAQARSAGSEQTMKGLSRDLEHEKEVNRDLVTQLEKSVREAGALQSSIQELQTDFNAAEAAVQQFREREQAGITAEREHLEIRNQLEETIRALNAELQTTRNEMQSVTQNEQALEQRVHAMEAEKETLSKRGKDLEQQILTSEEENAALTRRNVQLLQKIEPLETALKELQAELKANQENPKTRKLEKELRDLQKDYQDAEEKEKSLAARLDEQKKQTEDSRKTIRELEIQLANAHQDSDALRESLQRAAQDLRALETQSREQALLLEKHATDVSREDYENVRQENVDLQYQLTSLKNSLARDSNDSELKKAYQKAEERIAQLQEDLKKSREAEAALRLDQEFNRQSTNSDTSSASPKPEPVPVALVPTPATPAAGTKAKQAEQAGEFQQALDLYKEALNAEPLNLDPAV